MTDTDLKRSNNTGTGAKALDRDDDLPTPSHSGSSGGQIQREIGSLDEEKTATGADAQPTSVHKGMKPEDGDEPNLPNRHQTGETKEKAAPRRG